jgi:hypothetical protein
MVSGVVAGAGLGLMARHGVTVRITRSLMPARRIRWQLPDRYSVGFGVLLGIGVGILSRQVVTGISTGFLFMLGTWVNTQQGTPLAISSTVSPPDVLERDRRAALIVWMATGLAFGGILAVVTGVLLGITVGAAVGAVVAAGILIVIGLGFGALICFAEAAWLSYGIARIYAALRKHLP